jgi:hypothetical protein
LALVACGSVPQPFRGTAKVTKDNPLIDVPSGMGVGVLPITGLAPEVSEHLAKSIAERLLEMEVPAEPVDRAGGLGFILMGTADEPVTGPAGTKATITWVVRTRRGVDLTRFTQTMQVPPQGPVSEARETAAQIAFAMGLTDAPVMAAGVAAAPGMTPLPSISVNPVEGAPGDGRDSLRLAVLQALVDAGFRREDSNPDITLLATFKAERNDFASQRVTITWHAITRDGRELGHLDLDNVMPDGALDGAWGPTAFAVAAAAQGNLAKLLTGSAPVGK